MGEPRRADTLRVRTSIGVCSEFSFWLVCASILGIVRFILLFGVTLSGLMMEHDVSFCILSAVALKRIDLDYFDDGEV